MVRPKSEYPTELELEILKILWKKAPLPVRDVREGLKQAGRDLAHTSVITTLNTMVQKGTLARTREGNSLLFSPRFSQEEISGKMLDDVVSRVFEGSASSVVLRLFDQADITPDQLKELRTLINRKLKGQ